MSPAAETLRTLAGELEDQDQELETLRARIEELEERLDRVHPLDRFVPLPRIPDLWPHWSPGRLRGLIQRHPDAPWIVQDGPGAPIIVDTVALAEWMRERGK